MVGRDGIFHAVACELRVGMPDSAAYPLEQLAAVGPWDGPTYHFRGAEIRCCPGGHVCGLVMLGHPLDGRIFGVPGTITPLVDLWLDERRLPVHIRGGGR